MTYICYVSTNPAITSEVGSDLYVKRGLECLEAPDLVRVPQRIGDDAGLAEQVVTAVVRVRVNPEPRLKLPQVRRHVADEEPIERPEPATWGVATASENAVMPARQYFPRLGSAGSSSTERRS